MKRFQMGKKTALTILLGSFRSVNGVDFCPEGEKLSSNGITTNRCEMDTNFNRAVVGEGCSTDYIEDLDKV